MLARLRTYASFVRFSHSVFALPFALVGALLAARFVRVRLDAGDLDRRLHGRGAQRGDGLQPARRRGFDARNPRTAMRELPRGPDDPRARRRSSSSSSSAVVRRCAPRSSAGCASCCRRSRSRSCSGIRWPSGSRPTRRCSSAWRWRSRRSAAGLPPGGRCALEPWLLGLAIGSWVAGFDVLYACQDSSSIAAKGCGRFPVRFGIRRSLAISRALHVVTVRRARGARRASPARRDLRRRASSSSRCCWSTSSRSSAPTISRRSSAPST